MIEIIPALLPKSFEELEEGLGRLRGVARVVQVDLVGMNVLEGEESIPFWDEFDFEADIMLASPSKALRSVLESGPSRVVIHANAPDAKEAIAMLQETREGEYKIEVGIALAAHDTLEVLLPFENLFDYVQVMGIDNIGKQGEPPDPHHKELELIKALHEKYPEMTIQVDGAAGAHPRELVEAGASRLIVGSRIINAPDPKQELKAVYTEATHS
jgi:pentose-5-phosphate-3-epimerase